MYKRLLVSHKLLWSVSVHVAGVVPHLVGTAWAQRVLLVLALPQLQLLDLRLPEAEPEHGAVLVLVIIIPNMGICPLTAVQGETKKGAHALQGEKYKVRILGSR